MELSTAVTLINDAAFLPGWQIVAEDHTRRFGGTIKLSTVLDTVDTNRENVARDDDGRPYFVHNIDGGARAAFEVYVGDVQDREQLALKVVDKLTEVFRHEAREALRWGDTLDASLHPHRPEGMSAHERLTGTPLINDYSYGTA